MKLIKNPIFWAFVLFLGGMIVGGIGWDKHDSTIEARTHGSVVMIIIGIAMIVVGGVMFFTVKGNKE